jgi:hypothetical protein
MCFFCPLHPLQVLDCLLPEMENRRDKLVVVFAGYAKQMDELMAFNEGLPSRFATCYTFPDYTAVRHSACTVASICATLMHCV